ncbi:MULTISPECIES: glycoside hydrolase family 2 TIM barrel-domain containing protein [unclassified Lentimonas]|uniref:glycoside hydrolase family 2 protein n=1 Tax=unclassified Lentimonas TaxID=2630993 RepID=UPI0013895CAC|nr:MULTISPECIES: glycoside hydrolase family 2 TIM barrel-domain containing protein [unclassified Lentimonas]
MKKISILCALLASLSFLSACSGSGEKDDGNKVSLSTGWKYLRLDDGGASDADFHTAALDDASWDAVRLPHTANIEPLVVNDQWQGICWYRKSLDVPAAYAGKKLFVELEAAMNYSQIWINGTKVMEHQGGYLPVVLDATDYLNAGESNLLAIRLDNTDNEVTGPKPLKILDFNMYGGLYRNASLTVKDQVYISHPVLADQVAGGGIFITTPKVAEAESEVQVKTHVINEAAQSKAVTLVQSVYWDGKLVNQVTDSSTLAAGEDRALEAQLSVTDAQLWSPDAPNLYELKSELIVDGHTVETQRTRFGIREFEFRGTDLYLNGEQIYLRGVNRHQEYPFVGYALSDNAQYRDAMKIKEAGFNAIRLSHYPHSTAFMDACDELGIITIDAFLGWQYYNDTNAFKNNRYDAARQLIRRDRNHPSVVMWEMSLNETKMPIPFMEELHQIVHEEYPGQNVYSSGWMPDVYDVFFQARQHRILHGYHPEIGKPYFVSEYGDWEYYSSNAGLNQDKLDKTTRLESSSRQLRAHGEKRLLQQAYNLQESYNDNLGTMAFGDGYWVMYDYNRGYHDELEASGIMDIFRLPKFSYDFYQSQREPSNGVVVKIASYWQETSALDLKVFSNCDTVELFLNDRLVAKQQPDTDENSTHLGHPPFTFKLDAFEAGTLKAVGYIDGKVAAEHAVQTPGEATDLVLRVDESGKAPQAGVNDVVFVYISAVDANGTVVPDYAERIEFEFEGDVRVMNVEPVTAEAGIAPAVIQIGDQADVLTFTATAEGLGAGQLTIHAEQ